MLMSVRRGFLMVVRAIEQLYNIGPSEELLDPNLVTLVEQIVDKRLRETRS